MGNFRFRSQDISYFSGERNCKSHKPMTKIPDFTVAVGLQGGVRLRAATSRNLIPLEHTSNLYV